MINESPINISRHDLPQVDETVLEKMIRTFLSLGGTVEYGQVDPDTLIPTQSVQDCDPEKVAAIKKSNTVSKFPVVISNDNYILDGHHRWLAAGKELTVLKFDIPIMELLKFAKGTPAINTIKESVLHSYRRRKKKRNAILPIN